MEGGGGTIATGGGGGALAADKKGHLVNFSICIYSVGYHCYSVSAEV